MKARAHGRPDRRSTATVLTGAARGPSPLLLTAALALVLALVRAAGLVGGLLDRPPAAGAAGDGRPAVAAGPNRSSESPGEPAPAVAGASEVSSEALLAVPAVEPAAGPPVEPRLGSPGDPLADVAAELARRAAELEGRERELALREAAAAAVETRLGEQLARLEGLKKELEALARRIAGQDEAEIAQLVKTYEAMKARSAAQVFDQLALDLLLPIVRRMREAKLAAILAAMEPARAKQVTAALAQQTPLPRLP
jgi:hypothetical protein